MPEQDDKNKNPNATDDQIRDLEPGKDPKGGLAKQSPGGGGSQGGPPISQE